MNLVLLLVDCLRHDRVEGLAGGARIPALAALREASTRFVQTVSAASLTTPSVASLLTGLDPVRHGVRSLRGYRLPDGIPTLAGRLAAAGVQTRAEVTGPLLALTGLGRGFAAWRCRDEGENVFSRFGARLLRLPARLPRPFFLFVHLWELHRPRKVLARFDAPEHGEGPYDRALSSLDPFLARLLDALPEETAVVLTGDHGEAVRPTDSLPAFWRRVSRIPLLEPRRDRQWRRARDRRPPPDVPGEGPCHGFDVTEEMVRVPLLLRGGAFPPGLALSAQARHVDVMPTVLDAFGLPPPEAIDGRSLLPLACGEALPPAPAWCEATGRALAGKDRWIAAVRTEEWKYARRLYGRPPEERLFDLRADPGETTNLVAAAPPALAGMRETFALLAAREAPEAGLAPADREALDARLRGLGYLGGAP